LTKTLLFYAVHALATQIPLTSSTGVLVNVVNPGMTISNFGEDRDKPLSASLKRLKTTLMSIIARSTDVGARTLVHAVELDLRPEAHGNFLMDSRIVN
jgi:short-subunit dehydrogenase